MIIKVVQVIAVSAFILACFVVILICLAGISDIVMGWIS